MGLFFPDDPNYDEAARQTGFYRYRQLISNRFGRWLKINLLTVIGFIPLAIGLFAAIASSSVLVLIPTSVLGGAFAGPFLAGMFDAIMRGLRDDYTPWWEAWLRSWRQNGAGAAVAGAVLGFLLGMYVFTAMLFWWAETLPTLGTVMLYLTSLLFLIVINTLFWPQLVLFRQTAVTRFRNCVLFFVKYFWRVMGAGVLQLVYWAVYVLFAPWTLLLLPFLGFWYILFLSQLIIYSRLDMELHIEELIEGQQSGNSPEEDD